MHRTSTRTMMKWVDGGGREGRGHRTWIVKPLLCGVDCTVEWSMYIEERYG